MGLPAGSGVPRPGLGGFVGELADEGPGSAASRLARFVEENYRIFPFPPEIGPVRNTGRVRQSWTHADRWQAYGRYVDDVIRYLQVGRVWVYKMADRTAHAAALAPEAAEALRRGLALHEAARRDKWPLRAPAQRAEILNAHLAGLAEVVADIDGCLRRQLT